MMTVRQKIEARIERIVDMIDRAAYGKSTISEKEIDLLWAKRQGLIEALMDINSASPFKRKSRKPA